MEEGRKEQGEGGKGERRERRMEKGWKCLIWGVRYGVYNHIILIVVK